MKRVCMAITLVVGLLTVTPGWAQVSTPAAPDSGPYLAVYVAEIGDEPSENARIGEPCSLYWHPNDLYWTLMPNQIVIKDASGSIISLTDVAGIYKRPEGETELSCTFESYISLPESPYYSVYLNDSYLVTYTIDTLPTDLTYDPLLILLGDPPF